jgi:hypothetical protein
MGLQAAVVSGLAVTAISQSTLTPGMRQLSQEEGFPVLPNTSFLLHRNPESQHCAVDSLAEHICKAFGTCTE